MWVWCGSVRDVESMLFKRRMMRYVKAKGLADSCEQDVKNFSRNHTVDQIPPALPEMLITSYCDAYNEMLALKQVIIDNYEWNYLSNDVNGMGPGGPSDDTWVKHGFARFL
jgi:hypothetical protein